MNIIDSFDEHECCGCCNCVTICPVSALKIKENKYGFVIPEIDRQKCVECGKCISVCPYNSKLKMENYPLETFAALNKNKDVVFNSSSGGVFYEIAKKVIQEDGIVYGASLTKDFYVRHIEVTKIEDIKLLQKSKYLQSDISGVFSKIRKHLKNEKVVLFSGTPCQVYALYCFLGDVIYDNLITVDVVCHGVPSPRMFREYITVLEKKLGVLKDYVFRAKKQSNNGMNDYVGIKTNKKEIIKNWNQDSFNGYMMKGLINRESCYTCKFATEKHVSDITLMDFWHWELYHADAFAIDASVSGIVINSIKGKGVFSSIKKNLRYIKSEYEIVKNNNPCICRPSGTVEGHSQLMELWIDKGYEFIHKMYYKKNIISILKSWIMIHLPQKLVIRISRLKHGH